MSDEEPIRVESTPDVGSERLAAALAAGDWVAMGQALRHDYVVLPLIETAEGETQNRVFPSGDEAKPYSLALFSSTRTLELFLRDDERRQFALVRGPGLVPFLEQRHDVLHRVHFDPAGPHAGSADVDDTLRALEPRLLDDDVAWASAEPGPTDAVPAGAPGDRFLASLVRRNDQAAAAVNLALYWHELGPAIGDRSHLERMTERLRGELGADGELVGAETPAGPFIRHTRLRRGAAELAASDRPPARRRLPARVPGRARPRPIQFFQPARRAARRVAAALRQHRRACALGHGAGGMTCA